MKHNIDLPKWLPPFNGLQDGTPYAGRPVGNIPNFMPLYNSLKCDILQSLHMQSVLRCYILDGEVTDEEESNMRFSYSTLREIVRGLKRIRDYQIGGTPSSAMIIKNVDLTLNALEIVYHLNSAAVEEIVDRNGHKRK